MTLNVTEIVIICVLIVAREWTKKITVFWDVTCNLVEVYWRFSKQKGNEFFLYIEVGGNKSLRNVGKF